MIGVKVAVKAIRSPGVETGGMVGAEIRAMNCERVVSKRAALGGVD